VRKWIRRHLPENVLAILRRIRLTLLRARVKMVHAGFAAIGLNIVKRKDFYSPIPDIGELAKNRSRWERPSALKGIRFDPDSMRSELSRLHCKWGEEYEREAGDFEANQKRGFGHGYTRFDARLLYYMLRELEPSRYLEIGSGLSTYYASLATRAKSSKGRTTRITCVEPYPFPVLESIAGITIRRDFAQNIPISAFSELEAGDVLFIDSSHMLKIDSDVAWILLEVLPILRPGVVVHLHDVPFPYNTPYPSKRWIFGDGWPMYWNEAMAVQAFLCFNTEFEIVMSAPLLRYADEHYFLSTFRDYTSMDREENPFSSLWIRRV